MHALFEDEDSRMLCVLVRMSRCQECLYSCILLCFVLGVLGVLVYLYLYCIYILDTSTVYEYFPGSAVHFPTARDIYIL